jgi:SAM-dependent methyltransferase
VGTVTIDRTARITFDRVAELYDEVRPGYPEELVEDVLALSGIPPDGRILEVGCGPGTATVAFARRGYRMDCIELGPRLAALAVENCRAYPNVRVHNSPFEDWPLEAGAYDLVFSAEAFHWIPPEVAYPRAARALKDSGSLALFWILYQDPESELFQAIDQVYRQQAPQLDNPNKAITPEWLTKQIVGNFGASGCFGQVTVRQYPWSQTYSGEQYIKLLCTMSAHRGLDEETWRRLLAGILDVIEQYGGRLTRPFLAFLFHARMRKVEDTDFNR